MKRTLKLRGISGEIKGRTWESDSLIRAGRLASLEIALEDTSVSRKHAEVKFADNVWSVRDLESTNGTYINGVKIGPGEHSISARDIIQFGKVAVLVESVESSENGDPVEVQYSDRHVVLSAASSYDEGIRRFVFDRNQMPRAGNQLEALLRAGHHFVNTHNEDQLLDAILNDAVSVLDAQRGAIVMAEGEGIDPTLRLRVIAHGNKEPAGRFHYSKKITSRCFARGESLLYSSLDADDELKMAQSISDGSMASVLCVLLRTPRGRLGVLHLDRSFWQKPFSEEDLFLADALAAHVSAAIESAQLLRKQREFFIKTLTILGDAVELKDDYTGGHTQRVTKYATMLALKLELPPDQVELVKLGTPLHDIGKIGIDDAILRKPGRLTPEEFAIMQEHTTKGAQILSSIAEMKDIIPIVRHHHERWDGTGYPDRLAGAEIPKLARIVSVADAFDAMTSRRPYHVERHGKSPSKAFDEVEKQAGRQFDPECAAAFLAIRKEIFSTMTELDPDAIYGDDTTLEQPPEEAPVNVAMAVND